PYSLFGTPEPLERDWYRRTGVYPIHAVITLREDLVSQYPDLPSDLYRAFCAAKQKGADDRDVLIDESAAARAIPDDQDPIPYGIEPNAESISTLIRYATEQHLLDQPVTIESIFAPGDYPTA